MQPEKDIARASVLTNTPVKSGYHLMSLRLPPAFARPAPGQFVMVRLSHAHDPLLARPFSVSGFHRESGEARIEILFRVAGHGTRLFARLQAGDEVDLWGPIGHPFEIYGKIKNVILVAGGIGIAPIRYLLRCLREDTVDPSRAVDLYLGAKTEQELLMVDEIRSLCTSLHICTDDGSAGNPGLVTAFLETRLAAYSAGETLVCACGPAGMFRHLGEIVTRFPLACQVSLEKRMACGLGACLGCAVAVRGPAGDRQYQRVCHEGPVFDIGDILWE